MHVLIAPNAFKNSLTATEAADAIAAGLRASRFRGTWATCPVGDGGDGTAELLLRHLGGRRITARARDPLGRVVDAQFMLVDQGRCAIIELAEASGLRRLGDHELEPLRATSMGTGDLMKAALDLGVREIVLCVGGSATVDAGAGILQALGGVFRDAAGVPLVSLPDGLRHAVHFDATRLDSRILPCALTVICDVSNPLVGERGAAAVFGPQKGATAETVPLLESALLQFGRVVQAQTQREICMLARGGAAGGVAAGLYGLLDATLVDGIDYVLQRLDFAAALAHADVVITGEGSIDEQTEDGKGPWGVGQRAREKGAFVIGVAGYVPLVPGQRLRACFDVLLPIGHRAMTLADAMAATAANLSRTASELGNLLALREGAAG